MQTTKFRRFKNKLKSYKLVDIIIGNPYRAVRDHWSLKLAKWEVQYHESGLTTGAACEFMQDPRYTHSRDNAIKECKQELPTWGGNWRSYVGCWTADHAKHIEGDFAECGTNRGLLSRTIIEYINFKELKKTFYLVDMFGPEEGYGNCYEETKGVFAPFQNVKVIKGRVPEALAQIKGKKFAYVHIDMNAAEPEMAAIDFFWDKLSPGGIVLLCDYNIFGQKEQRYAWNMWARSKGVSILALPTTQGMIVKPN